MADKVEQIQYTSEELEEIERIVASLPGGNDSISSNMTTEKPSFDSFPADTDDAEPDFPALDESADQFEEDEEEPLDVSSMIREVADDEEPEQLSIGDLSPVDDIAGGEDLPEIPDFPALESEPEEAPIVTDFSKEPEQPVEEMGFDTPQEMGGGRPARDELDSLTSDEPASVDAQDVPADIYNEKDFESSPSAESYAEPDEFSDIDLPPMADSTADLSSFDLAPPVQVESEASSSGVQLDGGLSSDLPDLSDLSMGDASEIPEATSSDIPDIDMGSLGSFGSPESIDHDVIEPPKNSAVSSFDGMDSLSDIADDESELPSSLKSAVPNIPAMDDIDDIVASEPIPDIPDFPSREPSYDMDHDDSFIQTEEQQPKQGGSELSDVELRRLKHSLMLLPVPLMRAVKDAILNDKLTGDDTKLLVSMIVSGRNENDIRRFVEDRLHIKIEAAKTQKRKVLSSRSEYSSAARRARQKKLFKATWIVSVLAIAVMFGAVLTYQYVYKPWKAGKLIGEGVTLILTKDEIGQEMKNYEKAETIFKKVNDEYVKNYLPGFTRYARAYFDKKQYERSLVKLNQAYKIKPSNIDTLNGLGYFYKKVPESYYESSVKSHLKEYYYSKAPPVVPRIRNKYDVAIDFYLKATYVDPKNITALVGIGDVYFIQGEYLKARQYYENILKVDPDSIAGYSGLLNLFIERDDFPDMLTEFVDLRQKGILYKVPAPLLGKLAEYMLSKTADGLKNIRIEYGIQSDRIKDENDNPFPAVRTVLAALYKGYPEYPPLYVHYAKFAIAQKNYALVKGYVEQALEHAEKRGEKYYGALSLMGEYYYTAKDPAKAYEYFQEALAAVASPPSFVNEDFYKETEDPGKTRLMTGNIFYYFFDEITSRFGDESTELTLEDEAPDTNEEMMANYDIAMKYFEDAVSSGYSSKELHYNLGRIYYLKARYEDAMKIWLSNYDDFVSMPEMMYALGNAFYHVNNTESAKAEYQRIISIFERDAEKISTVVPSRADHIRILSSLASAYNNLGAVYLRKGSESRSNVCFWKSIEYAHMLGIESEFARVNLARTVRSKDDPRQPILDENIPFSVEYYRADMRTSRGYK